MFMHISPPPPSGRTTSDEYKKVFTYINDMCIYGMDYVYIYVVIIEFFMSIIDQIKRVYTPIVYINKDYVH